MSATGSILNSVKSYLGEIAVEDTDFDSNLIQCINASFQTMYTEGVGPYDEPFSITDGSTTWESFLGEYNLPGIDSYLGLLVQSLFDPSPSQVISGIREKNMERLRFSLRIVTQEIRDRAQSTGG